MTASHTSAPRTKRRRRPRGGVSRLATAATLTAAALAVAVGSSSGSGPLSSSFVAAHATGLRGPQTLENEVDLLDNNGKGVEHAIDDVEARRRRQQIPQHGKQRPRRPVNYRDYSANYYSGGDATLPPGHRDGQRRLVHRRLFEEGGGEQSVGTESEEDFIYIGEESERELARRRPGKQAGRPGRKDDNKKKDGKKDKDKKNDDEKRKENEKRKEANKKKKEMKAKLDKIKQKGKNIDKGKKDDKSKKDKRSKKSKKSKKRSKKKPKRPTKSTKRSKSSKSSKSVKKKDKDKPEKLNGKLKPGNNKPEKDDKPKKKPNKKPGKKPGEKKPGKLKDETDIHLFSAGVSKLELSKLTDDEKEKLIEMTDGKFSLEGYNYKELSEMASTGGDAETSASTSLKPYFPQPPKPSPLSSPSVTISSSNGVSRGKWTFVPSLSDVSESFDGFERSSKLDWTIGGWEKSNSHVSEGESAVRSGITSQTYRQQPPGKSTSSDLTLTTDGKFEGGVLTFVIWARQLSLPNEAFYVTVDGDVALEPEVTSNKSGGKGGWVEYSVPVTRGEHAVTWTHVYNPFGLESLPSSNGEVGLWMDDLRYAPFTPSKSGVIGLDALEMTTGKGGSMKWTAADGRAIASSAGMGREGNADIQFVLHTRRGGKLRYTVRTSTTAPHNDFAILLNEDVVDAIFGEMAGFEERTLTIPPGKQLVTLRHRENPGGYGGSVLDSLGEVGTDGLTWLDDLSFEEN